MPRNSYAVLVIGVLGLKGLVSQLRVKTSNPSVI